MIHPLYSIAAMRHCHPMSGDVINLRRARKERARREKRERGDMNATVHGVSRAERTLAESRSELEARKLDGHRRDAGADDSTVGADSE
jgi:hypothetical protein